MRLFHLRKKRKSQGNLLDMVPTLRSHIELEYGENGQVTLLLPRTSWLERQSIRYLKQPKTIQVHLDELGSAVVACCAGEHSVDEIASEIRRKFGDMAEPLYPRLSRFFEILEVNSWIEWDQA